MVVATARASAPDGAEVSVEEESGLVLVRPARVGRFAGLPLPAFTVAGRAVAVPEVAQT